MEDEGDTYYKKSKLGRSDDSISGILIKSTISTARPFERGLRSVST